MEKQFSCSNNEKFNLELSGKNTVDVVNKNDNYKHIESTKIHQHVDLEPSELDVTVESCDAIHLESMCDDLLFNQQNDTGRKRQTTLSEYFSTVTSTKISTETLTNKVERDDASDKIVNVSLLISQLLNSRVVLKRISQKSIKLQVPTCKTGVKRYCYKCKTLARDYTGVTVKKMCTMCGSLLLYICDKCNESHFHAHKNLMRHVKRCNGKKTGKPLGDITLIYCGTCSFKTSYKICMEKHTKITGHNAFDGEMTKKNSQVANQLIVNNPWKNQVDQLQFLVNQTIIDYSIARKRYCPSCAKVITSNSAKNYATCKICSTTLLYQCGKCSQQYPSYTSIQYHLKSKCYPSLYRCRECKFTATVWDSMKGHLKKHFFKLPQKVYRDVQSYEGKQFMCEHCPFGTDYKKNFERHLQSYHRQLFI